MGKLFKHYVIVAPPDRPNKILVFTDLKREKNWKNEMRLLLKKLPKYKDYEPIELVPSRKISNRYLERSIEDFWRNFRKTFGPATDKVETIDRKKWKPMAELLKKINDSLKWENIYIITPEATNAMEEFVEKYGRDLDKLFFSSSKNEPSVNVKYLNNFSKEGDWNLLWPLVKEVMRLHDKYHRRFWGELTGRKQRLRERDNFMRRRAEEEKRKGKSLDEVIKIVMEEAKKKFPDCYPKEKESTDPSGGKFLEDKSYERVKSIIVRKIRI